MRDSRGTPSSRTGPSSGQGSSLYYKYTEASGGKPGAKYRYANDMEIA